ncbi:glycosyltransferase [Clostridium chromiireducens]|uniref:Putative glycosyltransferase EpsH n=1 Tax=Clostridium chromiireducens TaxID=225345 RepID=A0A1V4IZM0_9CLOT|nr:glycosyltransferase [Clostridium chromiireducens]OPJ65366.1 putative glycosyltransferase EpsH [Clostridium chromiireducens]
MYISIVICTYNRSNLIKKCINSILNNNYPEDNYEIVIVNNNSEDDTEKICINFVENNTNIRYIFEEKIGLSNARNTGIDNAKGNIIIFIDDDTCVDINYLKNIEKFFNINNDIMCAAGKIIPVWNEPKPTWFTDTFASIIGETLYGNKDRILRRGEFPIGANMIFKKEIFNIVGKFNSELGIQGNKLYLGEECDICSKIINKGFEIYYIANASVEHKVHQNKVDKKYVTNRLILEGASLAQMHKDESSKIKCILLGIKRCGILLVRDIPLYIVNIFNESVKFEKKCKVKRSVSYIKKICW